MTGRTVPKTVDDVLREVEVGGVVYQRLGDVVTPAPLGACWIEKDNDNARAIFGPLAAALDALLTTAQQLAAWKAEKAEVESSTWGDLSDLHRQAFAPMQPHEWDNMSQREQRNYLLLVVCSLQSQLAAARLKADALDAKEQQLAEAHEWLGNAQSQITRLDGNLWRLGDALGVKYDEVGAQATVDAALQQLAAAKAENAKAEGRVDWEEEYEAMYDAISSLLPPDDKRMLVERVAALHADAARWRAVAAKAELQNVRANSIGGAGEHEPLGYIVLPTLPGSFASADEYADALIAQQTAHQTADALRHEQQEEDNG